MHSSGIQCLQRPVLHIMFHAISKMCVCCRANSLHSHNRLYRNWANDIGHKHRHVWVFCLLLLPNRFCLFWCALVSPRNCVNIQRTNNNIHHTVYSKYFKHTHTHTHAGSHARTCRKEKRPHRSDSTQRRRRRRRRFGSVVSEYMLAH